MTPPLVDYLVARDGLPTGSGLAYDYVVGGDGVFVVVANPLVELRVPVAKCAIRGLASVFAACTLVHGSIPGSIWNDAPHTYAAAKSWSAYDTTVMDTGSSCRRRSLRRWL